MTIITKEIAPNLLNIETDDGVLLYQVSQQPNLVGDDFLLGNLVVLNNVCTEDEVLMFLDEIPSIIQALQTMYDRFKGPEPAKKGTVQ